MIYLFLAEGFEETEALATADVLRRAGCELKTVGVGGKIVTGSHGISVLADLEETQAETDGLTMVILPGGMPGTLNLEKSPIVTACVRYCAQEGKPLAAICAAPSILGHLGLLKGHRATCFPGYEQELLGAEATAGPTCVSGNIITARGAGAAIEFGLAIVKFLRGEEAAEKIRASMQCI